MSSTQVKLCGHSPEFIHLVIYIRSRPEPFSFYINYTGLIIGNYNNYENLIGSVKTQMLAPEHCPCQLCSIDLITCRTLRYSFKNLVTRMKPFLLCQDAILKEKKF